MTDSPIGRITLHPGKERSVLRRHPWIYHSAIAQGQAGGGDWVRVVDAGGKFLGLAAYSPSSKIRARVWSFEEGGVPDQAWFTTRMQQAVQARGRMPLSSNGQRLVHGEADGLPGVIVDRYDDVLVVQLLSAGAERNREFLVQALQETCGATHIYERSDSGGRQMEGLEPRTGWVRGQGSTQRIIQEHGWKLTLDIATGHKTGFYLDQRDNRLHLAQMVQRLQPGHVLNCYCYTGGFSIAALQAGAGHVTSIDSSAPALAQALANVQHNGLDASRSTWLQADVNGTLRRFIQEGQRFDTIVLDPPKFAPTAAHAERAARAYKDINRLAFKLLSPGGILYTFSCSGGVGADLFHKIVAGAAMDAGVDGYITDRLQAAPDHPCTMFFPEGEYLKGLVVMRKS